MERLLFIISGTIIMLLFLSLITPTIIKIREKKYLTKNYDNLMAQIYDEPIYKCHLYDLTHGKLTGFWSRKGGEAPQIFDTKYKVILYKRFLVITVCGLAEKISYNEPVQYKESEYMGEYYGNIIIKKRNLIYNLIILNNPNDFIAIKETIENYKNSK